MKQQVTLIDHMGSDLSVVNAARVSFAKNSKGEKVWVPTPEGEQRLDRVPTEADKKLISYLARHNHWTPFGHTAVTLHIKAPIFIARQLGKHQVGLVWNEVSRRYVSDEPEFYEPEVWRKRADNVKQGSSDEPVDFVDHYEEEVLHLKSYYEYLLDSGVCPEQARMVLPQSMMTEWYWTGSIAAFSRVYKLRIDPHSQKEVQEVADMLDTVIRPLFPVSWEALTS